MSMDISAFTRSSNIENAFKDFFSGAVKLLIDPIGFYKSMPNSADRHSNSIAKPMAFVLINGLVGAAIYFSYHKFGISNLGIFTGQVEMFVYYPIMILLTSFIVALIMFVLLRLLGSKQDFISAYWCVAFSLIAFPISMLGSFSPYLSTALGIIVICLLLCIASVHAHKIQARLAVPVFVVFAIILLTYGLQGDYALQHIEERAKHFATRLK